MNESHFRYDGKSKTWKLSLEIEESTFPAILEQLRLMMRNWSEAHAYKDAWTQSKP